MAVVAFTLMTMVLGACADPNDDNNGGTPTPTTIPGAVTTTLLPGTTSTLGSTTTGG